MFDIVGKGVSQRRPEGQNQRLPHNGIMVLIHCVVVFARDGRTDTLEKYLENDVADDNHARTCKTRVAIRVLAEPQTVRRSVPVPTNEWPCRPWQSRCKHAA